MDICKKENKTKTEIKTKTKTIKKEEKPNWYGKEVEEETASEEDIAKLEAMLRK